MNQQTQPRNVEALDLHGHYHVECFDAAGNLKWVEEIENLVTTPGKNDALDKYIAGATYSATFKMGLKGAGSAAVGDTQASHAGWLEVGGTNAPVYTGTRQTPAWSAASAGAKVMSAALTFVFTSAGTVAGCFLNNGGSATKDDTTGVLYSAGDFTGGSKTVAIADSVVVTYTASA